MERLNVYKCELCGNIVEVLNAGGGELVCCGKPMSLLEEKTADSATEKHVPVIEGTDDGVRVVVGSVPHPMEDAHFIQWIEVINGDWVNRKFLKPGEKPEAEFFVKKSDSLVAREYCNVHGHWKTK